MKIIFISFILVFYFIPSFAQLKSNPESVILTLECITSTDESVDDGPYSQWGSRKFNITVYKKADTFFFKEQSENYAPTWWGENLSHGPLSPPGKNYAGMDQDRIWGEWRGENIESTIEINRLNGSIKKLTDAKKNEFSPKRSYLSTGKCSRVEHLF